MDDETDRAAAALAEVVVPPARAAELQKALARLYRKRGEHDLAIRQLTCLLQDHADDLTPQQNATPPALSWRAELFARRAGGSRRRNFGPLARAAGARGAVKRLLEILPARADRLRAPSNWRAS